MYPEHKGRLAKIIVSEDTRAQYSIGEFKKNSFPRVAISVDMLDTGIDVPEVCNLVFAKPVFSKIKFWQMIGRGTRSDKVCKNRDLLPNGRKEYFKIFDFWNNFEYFDMHPEGDQKEVCEAVTTRIFLTRLKQLDMLESYGDKQQKEVVKKKILKDVASLPEDSVLIRENLKDVEMALSPNLWDNVGLDPLDFLKKKMAPLMRYKHDVNMNVASFTLKVERLALALLKGDEPEKERLKEDIGEMLNCLPKTLDDVKEKEDLLDRVLTNKFWEEVTFDDCQMLLNDFSELMRYKRSEPVPQIILDLDDMIQERKVIEFGPESKEEYVAVYKERVEGRVKELADQHPTMIKISRDEVLTEEGLRELEETLNSPELYITDDQLRKVYDQSKGTLVQFIKNILGLYRFPNPEEKIREAFQTYIIENNRQYTADQLNFIRTIGTVFCSKKHIEVKDFFNLPFTNFGLNAPTPMFSTDELSDFVAICNQMEEELFTAET